MPIPLVKYETQYFVSPLSEAANPQLKTSDSNSGTADSSFKTNAILNPNLKLKI